MESILYLANCARKLDGRAAAGHPVYRESMARKPGLEGLEVGVANAKPLTELGWTQESVIVRRILVLNRLEIRLEVCMSGLAGFRDFPG